MSKERGMSKEREGASRERAREKRLFFIFTLSPPSDPLSLFLLVVASSSAKKRGPEAHQEGQGPHCCCFGEKESFFVVVEFFVSVAVEGDERENR